MATDIEKDAWLNRLYAFLTAHDARNLLETHSAVPDRHGRFQRLSALRSERSDDPIPEPLLDSLNELGLDWRAALLGTFAAVLIFRLDWSVIRTLPLAALGGLLLSLVTL